MVKRIFIIIFSLFVLISIDHSSKDFIENSLFGTQKSICSDPENNSFATDEYCLYNTISLGGFLGIQLAHNSGIAFSLPLTGIFLQIVTVVIILFLIYYYVRIEYPKGLYMLDMGYVLIFAGALSHAYERIFLGYVVDFIAVKYFAILNFADIFISVGTFLLFIVYYVRKQ